MSTPDHRPQDGPENDMPPRYVPPANQTATFDQAYTELGKNVDELVRTFRNLRVQDAATREMDIAGMAGFLLESPNTREHFAEALTVAVVRLAERAEPAEAVVERQVRDRVAAETADRLLGWTRGHPDGGLYLARLSCGHTKPVTNTIPPGDGVTTWCPVCRAEVGVVREITRGET